LDGAAFPNRRAGGHQFLATGGLGDKPIKCPRPPDVYHFYFEPPGSPKPDAEHHCDIAAILTNARRNCRIGGSDQ
jgi:hypothetical protein